MPGATDSVAGTVRRARRRPGENRERLIEAGLVEFGLFGYHGASTAAIAAHAEVPQPHVYANFGSKQELFLACAERAAERVSRGAAGRALTELVHDSPRAVEPVPGTDDEVSGFLFHAVSAARDPELGEQLRPLLRRLRTRLGVERFEALLARAAAELLD